MWEITGTKFTKYTSQFKNEQKYTQTSKQTDGHGDQQRQRETFIQIDIQTTTEKDTKPTDRGRHADKLTERLKEVKD